MNDRQSEIAAVLRPLRFVVAAQMLGLIAGSVVVAWLIAGGHVTPRMSSATALLLALAVFAIVSIPALAIFRGGFIANGRRWYAGHEDAEIPVREWTRWYGPFVLIASGIAEGFGFFGLVVLFLTGSWIALAAPLLAVFALLIICPSPTKLQAFVSNITGTHWDIHANSR